MRSAGRAIALVKPVMLLTDLGFIAFGLIPEALLFKDYHNSLLMAWNFSFLSLDLLVSAAGVP